jgi:hypothetical protein
MTNADGKKKPSLAMRLLRGALIALGALALLGFVAFRGYKARIERIENPAIRAEDARIVLPGSPFGAAWGFLYGYQGVKAATYVPQLRRMGGGFTKIYLIWNQVEPEKGKYDWTATDAFLRQLNSSDEGLIAVFSSSTWATRLSRSILPPSPAKDPADYARFIRALVSHCKGRVRYWQNDCEPNNPVYWAGTKEEFVSELKTFHDAVKSADPKAVVVAGGYDGLFNPPGMWKFPNQEKGLAFFDYVMKAGGRYFDAFDVRLYADPYTIPARVAYLRAKLAEHGLRQPILCTEYNGPGFFEFLTNLRYVGMVSQWSSMITDAKSDPATGARPKSDPIAGLYAKANSLAPQTRMFLMDGPKPLEEKFARLQCRDLVERNILALSAGVQKMLYWDFWHDVSDRDNLMTLMFGKQRMMDYEGGVLKKRLPPAAAFERMARAMNGVERVRRIAVKGRPSIYLFGIDRKGKGPLLAVWERRDAFSGEDAPPVALEAPWSASHAKAWDILGNETPASVSGGKVRLEAGATPVFVEAGP